MAVIDIGPGAIESDLAGAPSADTTFFDKTNPANASGYLQTFSAWAAGTGAVAVEIGTFYGAGSSWACRDHVLIGGIPSGSVQTFTGFLLEVNTNDCLGFYSQGGMENRTNTGGRGSLSGYHLDGATETYTIATNGYSIYATGDTAAWVYPVFGWAQSWGSPQFGMVT